MTFTEKDAADFEQAINLMASRCSVWLQECIHEGSGNGVWDGIKRSRAEFGHGVYIPFLQFETPEEAMAYIETGELPASLDGQLPGAYIDTTCIDDFIHHTGASFPKEHLTAVVTQLMAEASYPWHLPVLPLISMQYMQLDDGSVLTSAAARVIDWWDTEAETVPKPGITKAKVRKMLRKHSTPLVTLSTRNPLQAGKNLNVWMDVCSELNLTPMINAETMGALQHLSKRNRDKCITFPVGTYSAT